MNVDPVAAVLAHQPEICPNCDHRLTSAPNSRCVECGERLVAQLAVAEPSRDAYLALVVALSITVGVGTQRWSMLIRYPSQLTDGRLSLIPWYYLIPELALFASPILLPLVLVWARRIRRLPFRTTVVAAAVAAIPFLVDAVTRLF